MVAASIETWLWHTPTVFSQKGQTLEKMGPTAQVLVMGTSHMLYGVMPSELGVPGINLANDAQSLQLDMQIATKNLYRLPQLKVIVLDLSFFSTEYSLTQGPDSWRTYFYHRYYGLPYPSQDFYRDIRAYSQIATFGPDVVFTAMLNKFKIAETETLDPYGWAGKGVYTATGVITDEAGKNRADAHLDLMNPYIAPKIHDDVVAFVHDMAARNITVVLVTPPAYTTYTSNLDPATYARVQTEMQAIQVDSGAPHYDYLKDPAFVLSDFRDNDHLNAAGALKFSRRLATEVIAPALTAK